MAAIDTAKPILVTGGSGYIASWIIKKLVDSNHTVHATVRGLENQVKVAHLHRITEDAPGTLKLFEADLLQDGSFDTAMQGCELVMHTASPFSFGKSGDPYEMYINPAVEGTRNVLDAVNRTQSVKRVVLTSSTAAIVGDNKDLKTYPNMTATEENWNTTSSPSHLPYAYSKTIAEKSAWDRVALQDRWDLVVINPAFAFGPSLSDRKDIANSDVLVALVDGRAQVGTVPFHFAVVDVRDVAEAHLLAGFKPEASGRYMLFNDMMWYREIAALLNQHFGEQHTFPTRELPKWFAWLIAPMIPATRKFVARGYGYPFKGDNTRSTYLLGLRYTDVTPTLVDHFKQLQASGLV